MLKRLFRNLMGKTQHSPAGNEYLKKQKREEEKKLLEEEKKAKYKRSKHKGEIKYKRNSKTGG